MLKKPDGSFVELGHGAWGSTYKAFHTDLGCYVALKLLPRTEFADEAQRQRFLAEARAAGQIHHDNIALVLPVRVEDDAYIYTTEFFDDETVDARVVSRGNFEPAPAISIVREILAALAEATKLGLIHHCLTPASILLVSDDDKMTAKLLNLGLPEKKAGGGNQFGEFASPEEASGRQMDIRSNLYSVGACFATWWPALIIMWH